MDKNTLRKILKNKRKQLDINSISNQITLKILESDIFKKSINIALYCALPGEVNINSLLNVKNKNFYLPKCIGSDLYFAKYSKNLIKGAYSIPEPDADPINPNILNAIYIPCLCCNEEYFRLGYGKGYYDRFFTKNNIKAKKIIVAPKCLITCEFIQDNFDYKCDNIICENGMM